MAGLVGTLLVSLSAKTEDFERGMQKARREVTQTQQAVAQGSLTFEGLGKSMAGAMLGVAAIESIGRATVQFGKAVLDTGVKMENLRRSFAAIAGSAALGRQEFTFVTDTANRLGLDLTTLATSYQGLSAATRGTALAGQDTQALFVALSSASRTYGLSTEQTGRALTAFQQIISKGKVSQEELRGQLGEAIPGASQIAARAFGVTTQALDAMITKGVDAAEFTRRFTAQLTKETPAATAQAGLGFVNLGNEITLFMDRMAKGGVLKFFDDVAARAAKILEASRRQGEQEQSTVQRRATRVLGGEDPTKLLPANVQAVMALSEQLVKSEQALDIAQKAFRDDPRSPRLGAVVRKFQGEVDMLRQQETELRAVIKLQELAAKQGKDLLTEPGPQFEAQEKARISGMAEQALRDAEAQKGKFAEIDVRTAKAAESLEEADRKAKTAAEQVVRDAEQAEAKDAAQTVDAFRKRADERQRALDQLQAFADRYVETKAARDVDTASALVAQTVGDTAIHQLALQAEAQIRLGAALEDKGKALEADAARTEAQGLAYFKSLNALRRYEEQLGLSGGQKITSEARQAVRAQSELGALRGTGLEGEGQDILDRFRVMAKEAEPGFKQMLRISEGFADSFLNTMERATSGGIKSFKEFADSVIQDLMRIVNQEFLRPALSALVKTGLSAASTYFSPGGASFTTTGATGSTLAGSEAIIAGAGLAGGAPVMAGGSYWVGEQGPEPFIPSVSGRILSHDDAMEAIATSYAAGPQADRGEHSTVIQMGGVHFHGVQDMASFQRSRGEIDKGIMRAIQNATRAA